MSHVILRTTSGLTTTYCFHMDLDFDDTFCLRDPFSTRFEIVNTVYAAITHCLG